MAAPEPNHSLRRSALPVLLSVALAALVVDLYWFHGSTEDVEIRGHSAIRWMVDRWNGSGGDLSHGWLIPIVSGFLVWRRRQELARAVSRPDWRALGLILAAAALYTLGVRVQQTRLVLLSLILLTWGTPFLLFGAGVARLLVFPCAYLIFCIPLSFLDSLTFPLRLMASRGATVMLNGFGIAAQCQGTAIHSTAGGGFNLEVADPCSGLRSILAMAAVTALYAYVSQRTPIRQWLLFAACIPLAVCGNVVRILSVAVVAHLAGQDRATGFYHDYSSYVFFASAILMMTGLGSLLNRRRTGQATL